MMTISVTESLHIQWTDSCLTDVIYRRYSMLRVGLAPCSPFTVTNDLMKATAKLARQYEGVRLHTHLAENQVYLRSKGGVARVLPFGS